MSPSEKDKEIIRETRVAKPPEGSEPQTPTRQKKKL